MIVARGGGSIEELWAFNEIEVAEAVYESEIPIISAVGHETDVTICDFVSDVRAPTPSAAAEIAVPDREQLRQQITELVTRLVYAMRMAIGARRGQVSRLERGVVHPTRPDQPAPAVHRRTDEADAHSGCAPAGTLQKGPVHARSDASCVKPAQPSAAWIQHRSEGAGSCDC